MVIGTAEGEEGRRTMGDMFSKEKSIGLDHCVVGQLILPHELPEVLIFPPPPGRYFYPTLPPMAGGGERGRHLCPASSSFLLPILHQAPSYTRPHPTPGPILHQAGRGRLLSHTGQGLSYQILCSLWETRQLSVHTWFLLC